MLEVFVQLNFDLAWEEQIVCDCWSHSVIDSHYCWVSFPFFLLCSAHCTADQCPNQRAIINPPTGEALKNSSPNPSSWGLFSPAVVMGASFHEFFVSVSHFQVLNKWIKTVKWRHLFCKCLDKKTFNNELWDWTRSVNGLIDFEWLYK